ncbi:MAG: diaminopimelate epimerase, partial [Notoacmeibacter sp.]
MSETILFARMNGLGNMILVADMRGRAGTVTSNAAIALDANSETKFDQI